MDGLGPAQVHREREIDHGVRQRQAVRRRDIGVHEPTRVNVDAMARYDRTCPLPVESGSQLPAALWAGVRSNAS